MPANDWSDQQRYLGKTFSCSCGRAHTLGLRQIVYADDALARLPDVCRNLMPGRRGVVIADERTWQAAGRRAFEALGKGNWQVESHIVADTESGPPVCNQDARDRLAAELAPADWLLAVGSGVISDLTKWTAFDRGIPYAVVATAASMNGYAAANVATCVQGVKGLFFARPPLAILAQPSIIRDAPFELTAAGFGDQMAKPVSIADWILNHVLFDEHFCPTVCEMMSRGQNQDMSNPQGIRARQPEAIEGLFASLVLSGIAMTLVGSSAPASGGEHLLSHTLDMMAPVYRRPGDLHGRQVGLGCIFAAALYEKIVRIDRPDWQSLPPRIDREFWGPLADPIEREYARKLPGLRQMRQRLSEPGAWEALRERLEGVLCPAGDIKDALRQAGAAHCIGDLNCPADYVLAALNHQHEIRKRVTVIDLAWSLGLLPEMTEDLMQAWLMS